MAGHSVEPVSRSTGLICHFATIVLSALRLDGPLPSPPGCSSLDVPSIVGYPNFGELNTETSLKLWLARFLLDRENGVFATRSEIRGRDCPPPFQKIVHFDSAERRQSLCLSGVGGCSLRGESSEMSRPWLSSIGDTG